MKNISIEDLLKFRFIENLSFSPSGKDYAYQLAEIDRKKDRYFRSVYINRKPFKTDKSTSILAWYDGLHERGVFRDTTLTGEGGYKLHGIYAPASDPASRKLRFMSHFT